MTIEQKLQQMLGARDFQIAVLETQLEGANARIAELEKSILDLKAEARNEDRNSGKKPRGNDAGENRQAGAD